MFVTPSVDVVDFKSCKRKLCENTRLQSFTASKAKRLHSLFPEVAVVVVVVVETTSAFWLSHLKHARGALSYASGAFYAASFSAQK